jgi:hypothetical protein
MLAPDFKVGRWGLPVFRFISIPQSRGMARLKAHAPDYSRGLPIARASPAIRALTLNT